MNITIGEDRRNRGTVICDATAHSVFSAVSAVSALKVLFYRLFKMLGRYFVSSTSSQNLEISLGDLGGLGG